MSEAVYIDEDFNRPAWNKSWPASAAANRSLNYQDIGPEESACVISTNTEWRMFARSGSCETYPAVISTIGVAGTGGWVASQLATGAAKTATKKIIDLSASQTLLMALLANEKLLKSDWARALLVAITQAELSDEIPSMKAAVLKQSLSVLVNHVHQNLPSKTNIYASAAETITLEASKGRRRTSVIFDSDRIYAAYSIKGTFFARPSIATEEYLADTDGIAKLGAHLNEFFR